MKALKVFAIAIIAVFAFESAKAQVSVSAHIGVPVHQKTIVVTKPVHHRYYRTRTVVVAHPVHRSYYRRVVVAPRPVYHRVYHKKVVVIKHAR
ncbi:hypothetical protein [Mucilaginibacter segetis]|uniref:YXWGXW repeat-containing protein n=1 Tax=Mucilaginibacter segetis TaxID=2793071 RepID=A0A934PPG1_9SPHI|nr:hypothetical protein [Mucilaginibacter segetis]MBK0378304.1 hypothetical protein [Mucilaginibacter segetis]